MKGDVIEPTEQTPLRPEAIHRFGHSASVGEPQWVGELRRRLERLEREVEELQRALKTDNILRKQSLMDCR